MSLSNLSHNWADYERLLDSHVFLKEKSEEKLTALFHSLLGSNIKIAHPNDSDEYHRIAGLLNDLIYLRPGRKLIRRLMRTGEELFIQQLNLGRSSYYDSVDKTIKIRDRNHFYCGLLNGEIRYQRGLAIVTLAHELLHALHRLENREKSHGGELADPDLQNPEEQRTITGLVANDLEGRFDLDPLCENLFYKTLGMPIRINHIGLSHTQTQNPMIAVRLNALSELQSLIDEDPSLLNGLYEVSGNKVDVLPQEIRELYEISGKRLSLLSVAILFKKERVLDYLLEQGADIDLEDDLGGPLHAAIAIGDLQTVQRLANLGAKPRFGYGCLWKLLSAFWNKKSELTPFLQAIPWGETIDEPGSLSTPVFTSHERDLSFTPLMKAFEMRALDFDGIRQQSEIYETLLALGADPAAKSAGGETLLILFLEQMEELDWAGTPLSSRPDYDELLKEFHTLAQTPGMDLSAFSYTGKSTESLTQSFNNQIGTAL